MQVVFLAGGLITTPQITADARPKCLWPVLNRPVIEHMFSILELSGATSFVVCLTGEQEKAWRQAQAKLAKKWPVYCSVQDELAGTAGALKAAQEHLQETFVVCHGGVFFDNDVNDILAKHHTSKAAITIGGVRHKICPTQLESFQYDKSGRVTGLNTQHWSQQSQQSLFPCGLYVFSKKVLDHIPDGHYHDLKEQLVPRLLELGQTLAFHEMTGYWREVNSLNDYFQLNIDLLLGRTRNWLKVCQKSPSDYVEKSGTTRMDDSVRLIGPVVLGRGCCLEPGAQVSGPCVIGDRVKIAKGAVVSNSVLLADVEIGPGAYVSGSVLVENTKVAGGEFVCNTGLGCQNPKTVQIASYPAPPSAESGTFCRHLSGSDLYAVAKRLLDMAFSCLALVLAAPLMVIIALLIKISSHGPVFHREYRCTVDGRQFQMFKFRTMICNAHDLQKGLRSKNESDGPMFKIEHDPRATRIGRFLRKSYLDELPQLINVLKGTMSLVGPRPLRTQEMKFHRGWRDIRLQVKPGITGAWQLAKNKKQSFETWITEDVRYVQGRSFWKDLLILSRTPLVSARGITSKFGSGSNHNGVSPKQSSKSTAAHKPILCYHAVETSEAQQDPHEMDVRPDIFAKQMAWLAKRQYQAVSADELLVTPGSNGQNGKRTLAITFDDAYKSVICQAWGVLKIHNFKASVFVVVDRVGTVKAWEQEQGIRQRSFMSWDDIRLLAKSGWTIGSHTMTHRSLLELSDDELLYELSESKQQIERAIGHEIHILCYPYGLANDRVVRAAKEAGYEFGMGLGSVVGLDGSMYIPRREVNRSIGVRRFGSTVR